MTESHGRLPVIGIGEDGWAGLGDGAREALRRAPTIVGSGRQLALLPAGEVAGTREPWPSPMLPRVRELAGAIRAGADPAAWAVLASGDPMLHGVGATLVREGLSPSQLDVRPAPSAFALACARLGWAAHDTLLVSRVDDPKRSLDPALSASPRAIVYVPGARGAADLATHLLHAGLGAARFVVLERLGGPAERIIESTAAEWTADADPLHLVAIDLQGLRTPSQLRAARAPGVAAGEPRLQSTVPGLPDEFYGGDGQLTRAEIRAVVLAALAPRPGEHLWDIGAGSGTVAIEWCRGADGATASAVESRADRVTTIRLNAEALGVQDGVSVMEGYALSMIPDLSPPDAVFVGGGLDLGILSDALQALPVGGRFVATAVTLESEALLLEQHHTYGGQLVRLEHSAVGRIGRFTGWAPQRPIVLWSFTKPIADLPVPMPREAGPPRRATTTATNEGSDA